MPTTQQFTIRVLRDPNRPLGLGEYVVQFGDAIVDTFPCLTGSEQPNPFSYGGITPPIPWQMLEPIEERPHPHKDRGPQVMARIVPLQEEDAILFSTTCGQRTFSTHRDTDYPFMIHTNPKKAGSSTGCIVPYERWETARTLTNAAFFHARDHQYTLTIHVVDTTPNASYNQTQNDAMNN